MDQYASEKAVGLLWTKAEQLVVLGHPDWAYVDVTLILSISRRRAGPIEGL
jgi:hypothetical protein